jgi:hypothetical protein
VTSRRSVVCLNAHANGLPPRLAHVCIGVPESHARYQLLLLRRGRVFAEPCRRLLRALRARWRRGLLLVRMSGSLGHQGSRDGGSDEKCSAISGHSNPPVVTFPHCQIAPMAAPCRRKMRCPNLKARMDRTSGSETTQIEKAPADTWFV